jgi:hypothetical protein
MGDRPTVFVSYSRADQKWRDRLLKHLLVLERQGILQVWDDRRIGAGEDWREGIRAAMDEASIAVLLVTVNFLNSEFVQENEIPKLLDHRKERGLTVVPILVKPCPWEGFQWLEAIQMRPGGDRALSGGSAHQIEKDLAAITKEIRRLAMAAHMRATTKLAQQRAPEGASRRRLSAKLLAIVLALLVGGTIIINALQENNDSLPDSSSRTSSINSGMEDGPLASIDEAIDREIGGDGQDSGIEATQDSGIEATQDSGLEATQDSGLEAIRDSGPQCLNLESKCDKNEECCSRYCCGGKCERLKGGKRQAGQPCKDATECCSGNCCNGKCARFGKIQTGPCTPNECSCEGYCCNYRCVTEKEMRQRMGKCSKSSDCCSGNCCNGICVDRKQPCASSTTPG